MKRVALLVGMFVVACGSSPKKPEPAPVAGPTEATGPTAATPPVSPPPAAPKTLFERLGGEPAITAVVAEFVARTTTDPRIKDRFFNVDAENLKRLLVEFVCMATGGPCKYTGRDMTTSHAGMDLVDDEFTALVENLAGALDKFNVPAKEKGELLGALGPLKPQIVAPPSRFNPIDSGKLASVTKLQGTLKDKAAADLLATAVIAGQRGQRSYAEQLFTRAEMITGAKPLATIAPVFRAGAPTRITTATHTMKDTGAQPQVVGKDDEAEAPKPKTPKTGSLHGTIMIDGKPPTGLGVVMLTPVKGGAKRTAKVRSIEQRDKTFAPHLMAVPVGSTIQFPNFDTVYHNVFSLSKAKQFDLGMYKSGESRDIKFDKPGIVRLGCNLHANMAAYVIVVDAPHYTIVGDDGTYSFKVLAPGKYKVQAWHEPSGEPTTTDLEVKEGDNTVNLDLKAGQAGLSPDKFGAPR